MHVLNSNKKKQGRALPIFHLLPLWAYFSSRTSSLPAAVAFAMNDGLVIRHIQEFELSGIPRQHQHLTFSLLKVKNQVNNLQP